VCHFLDLFELGVNRHEGLASAQADLIVRRPAGQGFNVWNSCINPFPNA